MIDFDPNTEPDPDRPYTHGCPFLGLPEDRSTKLLYPSSQGTCYGTSRPVTIDFGYQEKFCLSHKHGECEVFLQAQQGVQPDATVLQPGAWVTHSDTNATSRWLRIGLLVAAVLLLFGIGTWLLNRGTERPAFAQLDVVPGSTATVTLQSPTERLQAGGAAPGLTATPASRGTLTPVAPLAGAVAETATASPTSTPSVTATALPSATSTPTTTATATTTATSTAVPATASPSPSATAVPTRNQPTSTNVVAYPSPTTETPPATVTATATLASPPNPPGPAPTRILLNP